MTIRAPEADEHPPLAAPARGPEQTEVPVAPPRLVRGEDSVRRAFSGPTLSSTNPVSLKVLAGLWVAFLGVALAQAPGLIETDTKLPLIASPLTYFDSALHLWNQTVFGGTAQLGTGFLFPMGLFFLLTHILHIPLWIAERIWLASLLTIACWGVVRLSEALQIGNRWTRVLAGLAYCAAPIVISWITTSGALLAVVFLPWVLRPLVVGSREGSPRRAAALSGIAVALMGGTNAVVVLAALPPAVIWLITRKPGPRRRSLTAWWILALCMACFWWSVSTLFVSKYGYNYLPFTETSSLTTSTASAFESLRGASNWLGYYNLGGPALPGAWLVVSESLVIVATAVVTALGLAGLCRQIPERLFLVCSLAFGAVVIAAGFAGASGGPFSTQIQHALQGPLAPFRNVSKFSADVTLPLVLGLAYTLAVPPWNDLKQRTTGLIPRAATARRAISVVAIVAVALAAAPFWRGSLYPSGGFAGIPTYWSQAGAYLNAHQGHDNALLVPGSSFADYTWGNPVDEPLQIVASGSLEWRNIIPPGSNGYTQMLDSVEQVLDSGTVAPGLAQYLAREGVNYVVERNDLNLAATGAPPPAQVHQVLSETQGLTEVASFGAFLPSSQVEFGSLPVYDSPSSERLRPVEIYRVDPATSVVQTYAADDPVVVSGGVGSLLPLSGAGAVEGRATVLSGDPEAPGVTAERDATWAITDGNQRRVTSFGEIRYNQSYLLGPSQELTTAQNGVPNAFTVVSGSAHQTVEAPIGAASVAASSFGSVPLIDVPEQGPAAAFDGDAATAWVASAAGNSLGQWVSITFDRPLLLTTITVRPLAGSPQQPTVSRVKITTDAGPVVRTLPAGRVTDRLAVAPGPTLHLKVTIETVRPARQPAQGGIVLGAGISDIVIPGVTFQPRMKVPDDEAGAFARAGRQEPTVVLDRTLANANLSLGFTATDDPAMAREFELPRAEAAVGTGNALPTAGPALSAMLLWLHPLPPGALEVTASSSLGDLPRFNPENLVEASGLPWIAALGDRHPSITLSWKGVRPVSSVTLRDSPLASRPTEIAITPAGGRTVYRAVPRKGGIISFPTAVTDSLEIRFVRIAPWTTVSPTFDVEMTVPVGLDAVTVPGLRTTAVTPLDGNKLVTSSCGYGPIVDVDGHQTQTSFVGTLGELTDLRPVLIRLCTPATGLQLSAGSHALAQDTSATPPFDVTSVAITPVHTSPPNTSRRVASIIGPWTAQSRTVRVGAGPATDLVLAQNFNPGWVATLGKSTLLPLRVDGWEQGFVVPAGRAGVITLVMRPDALFQPLLALGAVLLAALVALALVPARRRLDDPGGPRRRPSSWILLAICVLSLVLVAGPFALVVVPLLAVAMWRSRTILTLTAFVAFVLAGCAAAWHPAALGTTAASAFDRPAQIASVVALAAVLSALVVDARAERKKPEEQHGVLSSDDIDASEMWAQARQTYLRAQEWSTGRWTLAHVSAPDPAATSEGPITPYPAQSSGEPSAEEPIELNAAAPPLEELITQDTAQSSAENQEATTPSKGALGTAVRVAPHLLVWTLLLVPTIRTMARGWRPIADDGSIAIKAWSLFTLHFPLVGLGTGAGTGPTAVQTTANPGPLEFWLLGPFVRLDPGQGALLGSALLCAAVLSITIHVLRKSTGSWAALIFALVVADLAIVSPTPFVDPLWNSSFAFFWFLSFMGVAFVVGQGNLRYLPLLLFIGSVTIDSHLLFLFSVLCVLVGAPLLGWLLRRPDNYRWLWWTLGVGFVCWIAPLCQQLFSSHPNGSLLLHSGGVGSSDKSHTFGFVLGLRALSRAASLNPIWASPRPIQPLVSSNDVGTRNLLFLIVVPALIAIAVFAWRHKRPYLCSMSVITVASAAGIVALYARIPTTYFVSFVYVNLLVWVVGICIWLTFGLAAVTALRTRFQARDIRIFERTGRIAALAALTVGTVAATLVVLFPYGDQGFLLDFTTMKRVEAMSAIIEQQVPKGNVGLGILYSGNNYFQYITDEHGVAYLLLTAGWNPGMTSTVNGILQHPIEPKSPFVVFTERGSHLTGFHVYPHYEPYWWVTTPKKQ
jgi:arabinofuranan 3-O-arabinosyltransferase